MKILLIRYKITETKQHSVQIILMVKKSNILEIQFHIPNKMLIINHFRLLNIDKYGKTIKNRLNLTSRHRSQTAKLMNKGSSLLLEIKGKIG
jgi:hypothetical protein